jgi:hypothetical protein
LGFFCSTQASNLPGRHSTDWWSPSASPFCFRYFKIGSHMFTPADLNSGHASWVAGMTDVHHYVQLFLVEMGSWEFFA